MKLSPPSLLPLLLLVVSSLVLPLSLGFLPVFPLEETYLHAEGRRPLQPAAAPALREKSLTTRSSVKQACSDPLVEEQPVVRIAATTQVPKRHAHLVRPWWSAPRKAKWYSKKLKVLQSAALLRCCLCPALLRRWCR